MKVYRINLLTEEL